MDGTFDDGDGSYYSENGYENYQVKAIDPERWTVYAWIVCFLATLLLLPLCIGVWQKCREGAKTGEKQEQEQEQQQSNDEEKMKNLYTSDYESYDESTVASSVQPIRFEDFTLDGNVGGCNLTLDTPYIWNEESDSSSSGDEESSRGGDASRGNESQGSDPQESDPRLQTTRLGSSEVRSPNLNGMSWDAVAEQQRNVAQSVEYNQHTRDNGSNRARKDMASNQVENDGVPFVRMSVSSRQTSALKTGLLPSFEGSSTTAKHFNKSKASKAFDENNNSTIYVRATGDGEASLGMVEKSLNSTPQRPDASYQEQMFDGLTIPQNRSQKRVSKGLWRIFNRKRNGKQNESFEMPSMTRNPVERIMVENASTPKEDRKEDCYCSPKGYSIESVNTITNGIVVGVWSPTKENGDPQTNNEFP